MTAVGHSEDTIPTFEPQEDYYDFDGHHARQDEILDDAPCSAVGTIRRNPEIFFKKNPPNINSLVNLQRKLMNNLL